MSKQNTAGKPKKKNNKNKNKSSNNRVSNIPRKVEKKVNELYYKEGMTVADIANELKIPATAIIKDLMILGIMANQNHTLDYETVELICLEREIEIKSEVVTDLERFDEFEFEDDPKDLVERPAVVTILGHVDHGKTTLLDTIRNSRVTASESGGITQHIGAYQVEKNGKLITFIDTPGHAAFTEMRARGASITDIAILVVAADDGVMPQTREAIAHAKAANVNIIVAVNKMDKPGANPEKVMQELAEFELLPEEWGGDTVFCKVSALTGEGIGNLLEMINITAEMLELKANPKRHAVGTVIESHLDKNRGPVATLLVQNGHMLVGDVIVAGDTFGKVRTMQDDLGKRLKDSGPSSAIEVVGLNDVPSAGDKFMILEDERTARQISEKRKHNTHNEKHGIGKPLSMEDLFAKRQSGELKSLGVIVKADTHGTLEALKKILGEVDVEGIKVNIIQATVGNFNTTDISLAKASEALLVGFKVRPDTTIKRLASDEGVKIHLYDIIYKLKEEAEAALTGMLDPKFEEIVTGSAEIRGIIKISKQNIAGCYVTDGVIHRQSKVRLIRDGIVIFDGKLDSLRRFKDEVKEVKQGFECGMKIENFNDIKEGDIIECSIEQEVKRKK